MTNIIKIRTFLCIVTLLLISFNAISQANPPKPADLSEEIRKTEKQFESDLNKTGVAFAFEKYAAPNAVIKRQNDSLIYGPKAISQFYSNDIYQNAKASWSPDYIDISRDGTMAYTYGKYHWRMTSKSGEVKEFGGIFHTVWKKQPDGTWKYVWD
jgi:ketosteroid isomerase-like protein